MLTELERSHKSQKKKSKSNNEIHYPRNKSHRRRYLSPLLCVAEMHCLYLDKYELGTEEPSVNTITTRRCSGKNPTFPSVSLTQTRAPRARG